MTKLDIADLVGQLANGLTHVANASITQGRLLGLADKLRAEARAELKANGPPVGACPECQGAHAREEAQLLRAQRVCDDLGRFYLLAGEFGIDGRANPQGIADALWDLIRGRGEEIDRLNGKVEAVEIGRDTLSVAVRRLANERDEARAEVETLREALGREADSARETALRVNVEFDAIKAKLVRVSCHRDELMEAARRDEARAYELCSKLTQCEHERDAAREDSAYHQRSILELRRAVAESATPLRECVTTPGFVGTVTLSPDGSIVINRG